MGLPLPLPRPAAGPLGPSTVDLGFLTVSSTDRIRQAASEAAVKALTLTREGSHTQASKLSVIPSLMMSTPNHFPPDTFNQQCYINCILTSAKKTNTTVTNIKQ